MADGTVIINTQLNTKGVEEGTKQMSSKLSKLGGVAKGAVGAVGAVATATGALIGATYKGVKATAEYGDTVDKASQKMQISAETYQKLSYAAELSGTSMGTMQRAQKALLSSGSDLELVDALKECADASDSAAKATELFGARTAQELLPMLNQGSQGIDDMMQAAEDYGMVMSDDAVKASAEFNDSLTTLSGTATGLKNRLMADLLPGVTEITDGLALMFTRDGLDEGLEKVTSGLTDTINKVSEMIPTIAEVAIPILQAIMDALIENLPMLIDVAMNIILQFAQYLIEQLPLLLTMGLQIIMSLVQGITQALPTLIPTIYEVITQMVMALTDPETLVMLIDCGIELILALLNGLIDSIPTIINAMPVIIENIVKALIKAAPKLLKASLTIVKTLAKGFKTYWSSIGNAIKTIATKIKNKFKGISLSSIGKNIIQGLINGFNNMRDAVLRKIASLGESIKKKFKSVLGIASPSKEFKKFAKWTVQGYTEGIDDNMDMLEGTMSMFGRTAITGAGFGRYGYSPSYSESVVTRNNNTVQTVRIVADDRNLFKVVKQQERLAGVRL